MQGINYARIRKNEEPKIFDLTPEEIALIEAAP
jgi:hypothetical protein